MSSVQNIHKALSQHIHQIYFLHLYILYLPIHKNMISHYYVSKLSEVFLEIHIVQNMDQLKFWQPL